MAPLAKKSAYSSRVSFAHDVSIIDSSPLLFSPVEELASASVPPDTDLDTTEREDIQIATPTYALFPSGDPFEDLNEISSPRFPYLPVPLGFTPIIRPGDIPDAVESPSLFADSPALPGWFLSEQPATTRELLGLQSLLSLISRVHSGDSVGRLSSSSSVVLDNSDGDVGLLMSLLGLSSFSSMQRASIFGFLLLQCC